MTAQLPSSDRTWVADVPEPGYGGTAVVPVKPLAFAADTVAALDASPLVSGVVVVTADPEVERSLRDGVRLLRDDGSGLGPAVRAGCHAVRLWWPQTGVVVVPADLPCLVGADVTAVLAAGQFVDGAFVPDRAGTGTTMLLSAGGRPVGARYGPGSAARHRVLGLRCLEDAPLRARQDVDTVVDLRAAAAFGFGPATTAVLDEVGGLEALQLQAS